MEKDYEIRKEGSVLTVVLGENLSVVNSPALTQDIDQYKGQDVEKVVFDATKQKYISSSGVRVILYCKKFLGNDPEIVFVNCDRDVMDVFDFVGVIPYFTFLST